MFNLLQNEGFVFIGTTAQSEFGDTPIQVVNMAIGGTISNGILFLEPKRLIWEQMPSLYTTHNGFDPAIDTIQDVGSMPAHAATEQNLRMAIPSSSISPSSARNIYQHFATSNLYIAAMNHQIWTT